MVEQLAPALDRTFAAIADPTRRAILARLRDGSATVGDLAAPFDLSFAAVSKHVGVLERAGLLEREIRGRHHHCRLVAAPLRAAAAWTFDYQKYWGERLDALEALMRRRRRSGGTRGSPGSKRPARRAAKEST